MKTKKKQKQKKEQRKMKIYIQFLPLPTLVLIKFSINQKFMASKVTGEDLMDFQGKVVASGECRGRVVERGEGLTGPGIGNPKGNH